MKFRPRTLSQLGEMIVGDAEEGDTSYFPYRSSMYITQFFEEIDTEHRHDGSTRRRWAADTVARSSRSRTLAPTYLRTPSLASSVGSWTRRTHSTRRSTDRRRLPF